MYTLDHKYFTQRHRGTENAKFWVTESYSSIEIPQRQESIEGCAPFSSDSPFSVPSCLCEGHEGIF